MMLTNIVRARLTQLYYGWLDPARLECQEILGDGNLTNNYGFQYCNKDDAQTWVPDQIKGWDTASSADVSWFLFTLYFLASPSRRASSAIA